MSELDKLDKFLAEHKIKHTYSKTNPGIEENVKHRLDIPKDQDFWAQITVYENDEYAWDAICGCGSYGYKDGLLEVAGSITEHDVEGVFNGRRHYKENI